jgi:hypothetical protein
LHQECLSVLLGKSKCSFSWFSQAQPFLAYQTVAANVTPISPPGSQEMSPFTPVSHCATGMDTVVSIGKVIKKIFDVANTMTSNEAEGRSLG